MVWVPLLACPAVQASKTLLDKPAVALTGKSVITSENSCNRNVIIRVLVASNAIRFAQRILRATVGADLRVCPNLGAHTGAPLQIWIPAFSPRSQAPPGNSRFPGSARKEQDYGGLGGRASRHAFPGGAWERGDEGTRGRFHALIFIR
jgi:hypothetical protein